MKRLILITAFMLFCWNSYAQTNELQVIKKQLSQQKDSLKYVNMLNRISMLMYEKNIDSTFFYAKLARDISERLDYSKGKTDALNNLGIFFHLKGNLNLALKYYDDAFKGYRQLHDTVNMVQTNMNLAMVYDAQDNDNRSKAWFEASLKLGKNLRHDSIMSLVICNYILSFPHQFDIQTRRKLVDKAKGISNRFKDYRLLIVLDQLVANDLIENGQRTAGILLLDQAINKALSANLFYVSIDMMISMGNHLLSIDQEKAIGYYKKALAMAEQTGSLIYSQVLTEKLFNHYDANGNTKNALIYGRKLLILNSERYELNKESGIDYLDYALKEHEVDTLKTTTTYQAVLLFLALSILLIGGVAIFIVRKNNKKLKILNDDVVKQNHYLNETLEALQVSQQDNKKLIKAVAHDLRNPISAMTSAATLLLTENPKAEDQNLLSMIITAGRNSLQMLNDLLQEQVSVISINKTPVNIQGILQHCIAILAEKAKEKDIRIINTAASAVLPASREKLWRVLSNLITNAIKFSPNHSKIQIKTIDTPGTIRILVVDEGIGIPDHVKDLVFDMFTPAKRKGTAGEDSFGLGLAICKQIIEAHSGKIWFESNSSEGTTFIIELPKN